MSDAAEAVQKQESPPGAPPSSMLAEIGRSGLREMVGIIREEFLPQLVGKKALKTFKEMAQNDPVASGMLFAVEMFARQPDWFFIPPEVDGELTEEDLANTDFANSLLTDMSHTWQEFLSEALTMLPFGFAPFEIVYKVRGGPDEESRTRHSRFSDGRIGWRKLALRAQDTIERWYFDEAGGLTGLQQFVPEKAFKADIPIEKLVIFRLRPHKNNPEGMSILRGAWRAWWIKKQLEEIEAIGIERDLSGIPLVYVPADWKGPKASDDQKAAVQQYEDMVTRVRKNELTGLVLPAIFDKQGNNRLLEFKLVTTGSNRQHHTGDIIERWDSRMALSIQAQFMVTGIRQQGSFALASSQTHVFAVAIGAILHTIQETINRHVIPKLWALNGLPMDRIPQLRHSDIEEPDLRDVGNFILRLADAGFPIHQAEGLTDQLLRMAGLDAPSVGPNVGTPPDSDGGDGESQGGAQGDDDGASSNGRSPQASADATRRNRRQASRRNRLAGA